jgi:hypothetical protein
MPFVHGKIAFATASGLNNSVLGASWPHEAAATALVVVIEDLGIVYLLLLHE